MEKKTNNRLASLLSEFANKFELPFISDSDGQGANLTIEHNDKHIITSFNFEPSEDAYEFVAAVGKVEPSDIPKVSASLLASEPIRGITERITSDGKIIVFGSREGLQSQTDLEIQKSLLDDVERVANAYNQLKKSIE